MKNSRYFCVTTTSMEVAFNEWQALTEAIDNLADFISASGRKREGDRIWLRLDSESDALLTLSISQMERGFPRKKILRIEEKSPEEFWAAPSNSTP